MFVTNISMATVQLKRATTKAAGVDLETPYDCYIPAKQRLFVKFEKYVDIPAGYCVRIASKSGLSLRYGIEVAAHYIGGNEKKKINAVIYNFSDLDFCFEKTHPMLQLIVEKIIRNPVIYRIENGVKENIGNDISLKYWKLSERAFDLSTPEETGIGIDLRAPNETCIVARDRSLIYILIGISLPSFCYGRITSVEENSDKFGLEVGGGVLAEEYRNNVGVLLYNHTDEDYIVKRGDVIARLICQPIIYPNIEMINTPLTDGERGHKGFGSSYLSPQMQ